MRDATPFDLALRRFKVTALAARRLLRWTHDPGFPAPVLAARRPPHRVWSTEAIIVRPDGDPVLERGKLQNLRLAARAFDGIEVAPDRPLSFWRTLGPPVRARGFVAGMEVRGGCVVPSIGGGLCLLSNALFAMAAALGWQILERYGHSVALADPRALDATVAWPHIDLRIAPRTGPVTLSVQVVGHAAGASLHVTAWSATPAETDVTLRVESERGGPDVAGDQRHHLRVWRRVVAEDQVLEDAILVDDVKRVRAPQPTVRTCVSCDEVACTSRPAHLRALR